MVTRTVVHALLSYRDGQGRRRMALRGQTVELAEAELARAERLGAVVDGPLPALPDPEPVQVYGRHAAAAAVEPAATGDAAEAAGGNETGDGDDAGTADAAGPGGDGPRRPAQVEAKGLWVEYAVARGMDRAEAEKLTKPELIAAFPD